MTGVDMGDRACFYAFGYVRKVANPRYAPWRAALQALSEAGHRAYMQRLWAASDPHYTAPASAYAEQAALPGDVPLPWMYRQYEVRIRHEERARVLRGEPLTRFCYVREVVPGGYTRWQGAHWRSPRALEIAGHVVADARAHNMGTRECVASWPL